ncbi:transcriptional regulator, Rrf2 family [[Clostridium] methylpentosum DSM 5476]|jgi:Rrf2 family protein|uniref:Transcriptional regulator, Rrf2 family n=1 Tax=[Clostridium] methylpentosum DSM 5476 TaxID=537013 RepID=C0EDP8_9FIRM|nr:transcriptional regulator, Rrf2 family [[Clostridium] methylpentosum DSM 5476]MDY3989186.1 Rrf2 family transcriptional regulator [Massilioclostridium sp.]MEE1492631.1 Rrf2 family transcriptional regulator [Massilioclostridium sp.]
MKISSRFTVAVHCLLFISCSDEKITSEKLAASVNTNPVVIRKVLGKLKKAGLIEVYSGTGGAALLKPASSITLLDIFHAADVVDDNQLFSLHDPNLECAVGKEVLPLLSNPLKTAQQALESSLEKTTLADLLDQLNRKPVRSVSRSSISTVLL